MIRHFLTALSVFALLATTGCSSSKNASPDNPIEAARLETASVGHWMGTLEIGPIQLSLAFDLMESGSQAITGALSCPEQGIVELPVEVSFRENGIALNMKKLGASFEGEFNLERNEIAGQFKQAGSSLPLTLKKGEKRKETPVVRPQEPKEPFPYDIENVKYPSGEITIAGTLTLPKSARPSPAVLLIAGSGQNDRDEAIFGHKPFWILADHLTRKGIAVLRVDKRGVGESSGNFDQATTFDFLSDVLAGIDYLKSRPEIDAAKIGLIGHSEGGLIAPMAAAQSSDVAFIALMAGTGVNGEEILYEQGALVSRSFGIEEAMIQEQIAFQRKLFAVLKTNAPDQVEKALMKLLGEQLAGLSEEERAINASSMMEQLKRCTTPWFIQFLTIEPSESLRQVKVPVLAMNGELDLQVPPKQNLPAIAKALEEAGNPDFKTIEFPKLNHLFQSCETGAIGEYAKIEETISPTVLNTISDWILERT